MVHRRLFRIRVLHSHCVQFTAVLDFIAGIEEEGEKGNFHDIDRCLDDLDR